MRERRYRCCGCGVQGDAIDWLRHDEHLDFFGAVRRLAEIAGEGLEPLSAQEEARLKRGAEAARERRCHEAARAAAHNAQDAKHLWLAAQPLTTGDIAWRYLAGRGIELAALPHPPAALRLHPALYNVESRRAWPALVAAICAADVHHVNTHRSWFEVQPDGRVTKAPIERPKLSMPGAYAGGCVRLWQGASGKPWRDMPEGETLAVGEGIEDVLTIACARPEWRYAAVLGVSNFLTLVLPPQVAQVIWLAQNDPLTRVVDRRVEPHSATGVLRQALALHRQAGRQVATLRPPLFVKDHNEFAQWLKRADATAAARATAA